MDFFHFFCCKIFSTYIFFSSSSSSSTSSSSSSSSGGGGRNCSSCTEKHVPCFSVQLGHVQQQWQQQQQQLQQVQIECQNIPDLMSDKMLENMSANMDPCTHPSEPRHFQLETYQLSHGYMGKKWLQMQQKNDVISKSQVGDISVVSLQKLL